MRLLMLTSSLPYPPQQGGALRAFGITHGLSERGHAITLLSFDDTHTENDSPLTTYCEQIDIVPTPDRTKLHRLRDLLLSSRADMAGRLASDTMQARLEHWLIEGRFDLVQFEGLEMAIFLPAARAIIAKHRLKTHLIYDSFNAEYALQRLIAQVDTRVPRRAPFALYSRIQAGRLLTFERLICQTADAVIAVSPEDAAALRSLRDDGVIHVVPNGIFTDDYAASASTPVLDLGDDVLVFTGKMDYRPNVDAALWFSDEVLPHIQRERPSAAFYIVGQKPHTQLMRLRGRKNIEVTGWIPQVQPYLRAADVYVAPLRMGSGTRLKILEAMASGCAVVATTTAASGLIPQVRAGLHIADDADSFAAAVCDLLDNEPKRATMGADAQQIVRGAYDWAALIPCLIDVYREMGLT